MASHFLGGLQRAIFGRELWVRLAPLALLMTILGGVYVVTLLPGVGHSGDTAKFQFVGYVLGTPHATGYPGYVLLNHIFTRLFPIGTVAFRANLLSAVFACGASLFLYGILRELRLDPVPAAGATLIFGFSRTMWQHAVIAEVYTLHVLFAASVLFFLLRWFHERRRSDFIIACGLYAFSFGNHLLALLMLPAFAYFAWATDRSVFTDKRCIAWVAGLILLAAAQYLYFPWRTNNPSTPYLEMHARNWRSFVWFVSGGPFRGGMFAYTLSELLYDRIPFFFHEIWKQFGPLLLLVPFGLIAYRDLRFHKGMGIWFLANAGYALNYRIPDIEAYFLPNSLLLAVYIGLGFGKLLEWAQHKGRWLGMPIMAATTIALLLFNWRAVDQHANIAKIRETTAMLEEADREAVIIAADYNVFEYLMYYELIEGWLARNVYVTHDFDIPDLILYLRGDGMLRASAQPIQIPSGLTAYVAGVGPQHLDALRDAGLHVEDVRGGLIYRVTRPESEP